MSNRQTYAQTIRDDARIRGIRGGQPPVMPDGPELGLVGVDRADPEPGPPVSTEATMVEQWRRPATVTAVDCETATAKVDDWRIATGKVLPDGWGGAGTALDAHVDLEQRRVWLRPSAVRSPHR